MHSKQNLYPILVCKENGFSILLFSKLEPLYTSLKAILCALLQLHLRKVRNVETVGFEAPKT